MSLFAVAWYSHLLNLIIVILSLMLMLIVLIQRGKGGGLAGAFGEPGRADRGFQRIGPCQCFQLTHRARARPRCWQPAATQTLS